MCEGNAKSITFVKLWFFSGHMNKYINCLGISVLWCFGIAAGHLHRLYGCLAVGLHWLAIKP